MAYEMVMPYHLHMPSYFLETFTEYPENRLICIFSQDRARWFGQAKKLIFVNLSWQIVFSPP